MYFANESKDNIAKACMVKVQDYYKYLEISGRLYLYRALYKMYYKARFTRGQIYVQGKVGEYLSMDSADFRNLLQHLKSIATKSKAAPVPISTNTDYKSESQTRVARGILQYYLKDKKLDRKIDQCTEYALLYADGFMVVDWDVSKGRTAMVEEVTDEEGQPVLDDNGQPQTISLKEGDLFAKAYHPIDMACDYSLRSPSDHTWYISRDWVNKFEISAQFPELKDEIEALSDQMMQNNSDRLFVFNQQETYNSDLIPVYTLYHQATAAVPEGRLTRFLDSNILLVDGPLPIEKMEVYRMTPSAEGESAFGYSVSFDLLPICEAINKLWSTLITTESVSGIPILLMPDGSNMDVTDLSDGIKAMTYNPALSNGAKPETINLGVAGKQTYELLNMLRELSQVISAINAVARGETPQNLSSGSSLALVLSTAIEFLSGLQRSYADINQDVFTAVIKVLQKFAKTKRMMSIAGISNKVSMQQWDQNDLDGIDRVTVELENPVAQTAGGRTKMAEDLLAKNMIKNAKGYFEVLMTGRLDPIVEDEEQELLYVRQENEMLSNGEPVQMLVTDEHLYHIQRHRAVLCSKEAKENPAITEAVLNHIQDHILVLQDPKYAPLLLSLGQNPMNMAPPPQTSDSIGEIKETSDLPQGMPNEPQMPVNPMTGERMPEVG